MITCKHLSTHACRPNYHITYLTMPVPPSCSLTLQYNFPIFQYFACFFSILQKAPYIRLYVQNLSNFSVFLKFCQYLCSEFNKKNTGKSVYLEAMLCVLGQELLSLSWALPVNNKIMSNGTYLSKVYTWKNELLLLLPLLPLLPYQQYLHYN